MYIHKKANGSIFTETNTKKVKQGGKPEKGNWNTYSMIHKKSLQGGICLGNHRERYRKITKKRYTKDHASRHKERNTLMNKWKKIQKTHKKSYTRKIHRMTYIPEKKEKHTWKNVKKNRTDRDTKRELYREK